MYSSDLLSLGNISWNDCVYYLCPEVLLDSLKENKNEDEGSVAAESHMLHDTSFEGPLGSERDPGRKLKNVTV